MVAVLAHAGDFNRYICLSPMKQETNMQGSTLEESIDFQALLLHTAETPEARRHAWNELLRLRALRTPERIDEMERERGLR